MARYEKLDVNELRVRDLLDRNGRDITGVISPKGSITIQDDFLGDAAVPNTDLWAVAVDSTGTSAQVVTQNGDNRLLTSATDDEGVNITGLHSAKPNYGGLWMETRLKIATAVTTIAMCVGFTDSAAIEEPMLYATATATATATDAAVFIYDTDGTVDNLVLGAVKNGTVDTGWTATGIVPVADTYITLRVELDATGVPTYYVNGTKAGTSVTGPTATVALFPVVSVHNRDGSTNTVDVDYIIYGHDRV